LAIFPLVLLSEHDMVIELTRELATVVMLLTVSLLAVTGVTRVFAAFVYVFGLWDLFYYLWLKWMIGWPVNWLEWDVLFLIPWPWLGPWISAAAIAALFVLWGGRVLLVHPKTGFSRAAAALFLVGALLALAAYLLPAFPLLLEGKEALRHIEPNGFAWGLYLPGYLLMAIGLWRSERGTN